MKKLLALALIAGIPAASTLLSVVNPALAAPAQTVTPSNAVVMFPSHSFFAKTRLCARTLDGRTGKLKIGTGDGGTETIEVTSRESCIERDWAGYIVTVTYFSGSSQSIRVFTS